MSTKINDLQKLISKASVLIDGTIQGKHFNNIHVIGEDSNYIRLTATDCTIYREVNIELNCYNDDLQLIYVNHNEDGGKLRILYSDLYKLLDCEHFHGLEVTLKSLLKPNEVTEYGDYK